MKLSLKTFQSGHHNQKKKLKFENNFERNKNSTSNQGKDVAKIIPQSSNFKYDWLQTPCPVFNDIDGIVFKSLMGKSKSLQFLTFMNLFLQFVSNL